MNEKAFIVGVKSPLYESYIKEHGAREQFKPLARGFMNLHCFGAKCCNQTERLGVLLDDDQRKAFEGQLLQKRDENGLSIFKKKSYLQRLWEKGVVPFVDFDAMYATDKWLAENIEVDGGYSLFDKDGVLYLYLRSEDEIKHLENMDEISMEEYTKILKEVGNENPHRD